MSKYFLGTVGTAEAFRLNEQTKELELAFVSKTLTDSGLNISTTKDDIRAGQGAPIQFSFYHDPSVEITLTDVLWKKEYLEAQLGANFKSTKKEDYQTFEVDFTNGTGTLPGTIAIKPLPVACGTEAFVLWGAKTGTDEWRNVKYDSTNNTLTIYKEDNSGIDETVTGKVCIRTLCGDSRAVEAEISSLIIPQELFLIITAPIFAGDACAASKGKAAGHITFEVPRFQLNGAQEFSMNMSSNQTMNLAGIALASASTECNAEGGKLLRVIEVITAEGKNQYNWKDDVENLLVDEDCLVVGSAPVVYGEMKNGSLRKIDNADLTVTPALVAGKFDTAGSTTIDLTGTEVTETVTVAAE